LTTWQWARDQIDRHFADVCLMFLIIVLLFVVLTHGVFLRWMNWQMPPENVAWAREMVSAVIGCLLGRLARIDEQTKHRNGAPNGDR
jgi:uncharacterized integral membrane protein